MLSIDRVLVGVGCRKGNKILGKEVCIEFGFGIYFCCGGNI